MVYLNENDILDLPFSWGETIKVIEKSVDCIDKNDFAQPIKSYLRYNDLTNRIISMPAYIGGETPRSGLKWIASFPDNINKGITRAHSVIVLNEYDNGVPSCIINSSSISSIRTASVSGFMIDQFVKHRQSKKLKVGITGIGPIGINHLLMCRDILKENLSELMLYDLREIDLNKIPKDLHDKITVVDSWQEAYTDADIFITCTVSKKRYINNKPKPGSLHLNVSLRDYKEDVFPYFKDAMIVDSWEEVCRENTDIENFHLECGLNKPSVKNMQDLLHEHFWNSISTTQSIMFNPMGMAIFDIAISDYFLKLAEQNNKGFILD